MLRFHRWLGLLMAVFWILQAATGIVLTFRWEIEDATLAGPRVPLDIAALGARIETASREHGIVSDAWASSAASDRFDIYYTDASGADRVMRVDGAGGVLRDRSAANMLAEGALFDTLTKFHTSLFAGSTGKWLIGISGVLLLTNLVLGIQMAWPRAGNWARSMLSRPRGPTTARLRGWHRTLGLWGAIPAVLIVSAGIALVFIEDLEKLFHAEIAAPKASTSAARTIGPTEALAVALARYPGAKLSAIEMPNDEHAWYRVRLRASSDVHRNWGKTAVYISAANGTVIEDQRAHSLRSVRGALDFVYPFHTGQAGGAVGRFLVLLIGAWLLTLMTFAIRAWLRSRSS